jgi:hypothetical protein
MSKKTDPINGVTRLVRHSEIEDICFCNDSDSLATGYNFCDDPRDYKLGYEVCCTCIKCDGCFWACPRCGHGTLIAN